MENPPLASDSEYPEWVFSLAVRPPRAARHGAAPRLPPLCGTWPLTCAAGRQEGKLSVAEMELEGVHKFPVSKQIHYANLKHRSLIKSNNSLTAA